MEPDASNLVIVSNRLPVDVEQTPNGLQVNASPGGLAEALHRLMTRRGGTWIGWPGLTGPVDLANANNPPNLGYDLHPVFFTQQEHEDYYQGFANEILWPLFHDLHPYCEFQPRFWETYRSMNQRFAEAAHKAGTGNEPVWIHDYHLFLAGKHLRELNHEQPLGFFLHIPVPTADTLQRLPWHKQILEALTTFDTIGVQTQRDLENLHNALPQLLPETHVTTKGNALTIHRNDHETNAYAIPISTDIEKIQNKATSPPVQQRANHLKQHLRGNDDHTYIVGVERLDYTKGIPERLQAFRNALETYPDLAQNTTLIQHANPSREQINQYQELRHEVEHLVGRTNGAFGTIDWTPIRYSYGHLDFEKILALYRLADIALVTPLRDGMNLVAKEYCAANTDNDGVLILSKFAGAAEELHENALIVNPHDIDQTAKAIHEASTMPRNERHDRMNRMRAYLATHDVHRWSEKYLRELDPHLPPDATDPRSSTRDTVWRTT